MAAVYCLNITLLLFHTRWLVFKKTKALLREKSKEEGWGGVVAPVLKEKMQCFFPPSIF